MSSLHVNIITFFSNDFEENSFTYSVEYCHLNFITIHMYFYIIHFLYGIDYYFSYKLDIIYLVILI